MVKKVAFFLSSILNAYRHSKASSNHIQNIQNWPAHYSWKYEGETKLANEPTITVTVNTCQKYALKLATIGYFSAQRSTYNKKRTINNEEGFLEGVAQI